MASTSACATTLSFGIFASFILLAKAVRRWCTSLFRCAWLRLSVHFNLRAFYPVGYALRLSNPMHPGGRFRCFRDTVLLCMMHSCGVLILETLAHGLGRRPAIQAALLCQGIPSTKEIFFTFFSWARSFPGRVLSAVTLTFLISARLGFSGRNVLRGERVDVMP